MVPNPYAGGVIAKPANANTKLIVMGVAALAIVVLLVLLVRGVACSGGPGGGAGAGGVNLTELVSGENIHSTLSELEEARIDGNRYWTMDAERLEDFDELLDGLESDDDDADAVAEEIRKNPGMWKFRVYDPLNTPYNAKSVDAFSSIKPERGSFELYLADEDLTCAALEKELSKYMDYDEVMLGKEKKSIDGYVYSKDKDFIAKVSASEVGSNTGIWMVSIDFYDVDYAPDCIVEGHKDLKKNWDEGDYKDSFSR